MRLGPVFRISHSKLQQSLNEDWIHFDPVCAFSIDFPATHLILHQFNFIQVLLLLRYKKACALALMLAYVNFTRVKLLLVSHLSAVPMDSRPPPVRLQFLFVNSHFPNRVPHAPACCTLGLSIDISRDYCELVRLPAQRKSSTCQCDLTSQ